MPHLTQNNILSTARKFNGTSDLISFGNVLLTNNTITATMWINPTATPSGNYEVPFGYGNTRWFFIFQGASTQLGFHFKSASSETGVTNAYTMTLNNWYFVSATYDPLAGANNCTIRTYNSSGMLVDNTTATVTGNIDSTAQPLQIGQDPARGYYTHIIASEVRIYNRVLTTTEQNNLAQQIEPSPANLLLRCPLFESIDKTYVYDYSLSQVNGAVTGTTVVPGIIYRNPAREPATNI